MALKTKKNKISNFGEESKIRRSGIRGLPLYLWAMSIIL